MTGERIAIVGLGGLFPGAGSLGGFWENVSSAVDASREVPAGRWVIAPERAFSAKPGPDQVYSRRGYFLEPFRPDLGGLDIDPGLVAELDVLFSLALHAGGQAYRDAVMAPVDPARVGVILGSIALPTERVSDLAREIVGGGPVRTNGLNRYVTGLPAILLAQSLGLGGAAFTLDAACASSLYAIKLAVDELRAGRADAMLAGGLSRPDCLYTQMGFSQLRALSPSGRCAPFDATADGLVVGEGAGVFVLKRLSDALAHGDRVHGVIAGIGLSNDIEGNLLAPASEGQLRALRAAYRESGWQPADVDLIECHATGTPVGDLVEFKSLTALWSDNPAKVGACAIGSIKSSVGHLLTGAGAAGLMKVLLAMHHETLPPMANFRAAATGIDLDSSPFRVLGQAEPWKRRDERIPRRAAVSGFGFGGINAHLLVEEWVERRPAIVHRAEPEPEAPIAVVAVAAHFGNADRVDDFADQVLTRSDEIRVPTAFVVEQVEVPVGAFSIPPKEMEEMLPQQLLMLRVAGEAWRAMEKSPGGNERTGVFIGLDLDLNTTNFHLRWWSGEQSRQVAADDRRQAMDAASPPLTANRTMGALASIAASRVARACRVGGPSFTISAAELSGLHALDVAAGLLRRGEIDQALVGAVDFNGDPRAAWLANRDGNHLAGDGAVALILKRLDDARRDGDRVMATLDGADTPLYVDSCYALEPAKQRDRPSVHPTSRLVGNCGAASGLAAVARACLALDRRLLPARTVADGNEAKPQYWLHDSVQGPRSAKVEIHNALRRSRTIVLSEADEPRRDIDRPRRACELFLLSAGSLDQLRDRARQLAHLSDATDGDAIESTARRWWCEIGSASSGSIRAAFVARNTADIRSAVNSLLEADHSASVSSSRAGLFFATPTRTASPIAFVYPGSGAHYADMGRELGLHFPHVLDRQQRENGRLRSQYAAYEFWNGPFRNEPHPRTVLFGQVSFGTLVTDLLRSFAIEPAAVIGYSLGESAGLFGMRMWRERDEMLRRLDESTLFASDLAAPFDAARACWNWDTARPIDWVTGVVPAAAKVVGRALHPERKAYVLIVNSADECVVGGHRPDVEDLVERLGVSFLEVRGVTSAHCEVAAPVREAYRALHHLPVHALGGVRIYSGAWGKPYDVTADSAADSILAGVLDTIDFPRAIEAAYSDGVRTFVEIGPGASCSRLIDAVLRNRPHLARTAAVRHQEALSTFYSLLAELYANGHDVNFDSIYGAKETSEAAAPGKTIRIPVRSFYPRFIAAPAPQPSPEVVLDSPVLAQVDFANVAHTYSAVAEAHEAFLRFSTATHECMAETIEVQTRLLQRLVGAGQPIAVALADTGVPRSLEFDQCREFAAGSVGKVLGPEFAEADTFPTRVRLPDGPLMLVDRILQIDGEPRSMTSGRVVTEHRVHEGRWYLDAGRMPTCVAVEAGQADLFLSGFLGIDFATRGQAVYRLLDADVTFHRGLPSAGEVVRYDIHIDRFFRQGETHLFRFRFESTIDGKPLLTMTDGCAGFFTAKELASGKGIVQTELDRRPMTGKRPAACEPLAPMQRQTLSSHQLDSLRSGDLVAAFGPAFAGLPLRSPLRLPNGMLRLVDRVTDLDPAGGRFGLGSICAEADIHRDDWFLTCHFVDDMVMPGTLMYECCLHTLRILLMRMGWVGEEGDIVCEPLPGVTSRLKCRGQVIPTTKVAAYEVVLKEIGFGPEPFVIADALMYADGKPIVEMTNMSLRLTGLSREKLETLWRRPARRRAIFDRERILAFAIGKPSEAFGAPYRVFDDERSIARLPGPPYQFLDRITRIAAEPWTMKAGGVIEAEYDVPPDAWYFAAQRAPSLPFSILLEVALQPCGWLAAYIGSALTSPTDLSFRNLGGTGTQHIPVGPAIGTVTTTVKISNVSSSGGMIIQHYDFAVRSGGRDVYTGKTYFGFFSKDALANQVGLRECALYRPSDWERRDEWSGPYPREKPFPDAMLRMVDRIQSCWPHGGPNGLGAIEGRIKVDPNAWFFKAHFHQDPVWPGSLGLESFLQVVRLLAQRRWDLPIIELATPAPDSTHTWVYRGQVVPTDREVTVQAWIAAIDDRSRSLVADGLLSVDGRVIYQMKDFTLRA